MSEDKPRKTSSLNTMDFSDYPAIGGVMASHAIAKGDEKVTWLYRSGQQHASDSGWCLFSGTETPEFLENPENFGIFNPATILRNDASLASLLLSAPGSAFERQSEEDEWEEVFDYDFEEEPQVQTLTEDDGWSFTISDLFHHYWDDEDGTDVWYAKGRTVRHSIHFDQDTPHEAQIEQWRARLADREGAAPEATNQFDEAEESLHRLGYTVTENHDDAIVHVLYGFSISHGAVVMSCLMFDDEADLDWAVQTWRTLRFG